MTSDRKDIKRREFLTAVGRAVGGSAMLRTMAAMGIGTSLSACGSSSASPGSSPNPPPPPPPQIQSPRPGDWPANAIDRLGAVAWWGSSSHHITGGWAFSAPERFYGALFMGRTLGESLLLSGKPWARVEALADYTATLRAE